MTQESHRHGSDEQLCKSGMDLYTRALREGRLKLQAADEAPCVLELGLLYPDGEGLRWLRPLAPSIALPRLLHAIEADIEQRRRGEAALADAFRPLMALDAENTSSHASSSFTVLQGLQSINTAIKRAVAESSQELLTVQPGGARPPAVLSMALPVEQDLLGRGGRMRTLYQHSTRHSPAVLDHYAQLEGDVEVRTLNEVTERLVVLDRRVAFIPANSARTAALVVRQPALVGYLATTFDRLWDMATPLWPHCERRPPTKGITSRQRAIAALLIEGLTDDKIALRLAMNVRTVRVHIAKLADTLGTSSRAQLGYRIGQSGMLTDVPEDGR